MKALSRGRPEGCFIPERHELNTISRVLAFSVLGVEGEILFSNGYIYTSRDSQDLLVKKAGRISKIWAVVGHLRPETQLESIAV